LKTTKKKRLYIILSILALLLALVTVLLLWGNKALMLTELSIEDADLDPAFEGFRIAHVSDLHNTEFGKDNEKLLDLLENARPDIIAVTGDLIDSRSTKVDIAAAFMEKAARIAPCYYVPGNHEGRVPEEYGNLRERLESAGITVLENESVTVENDGESFTLIGLCDYGTGAVGLSEALSELMPKDGGFTLLLSHRPDHFEKYKKSGADLVLCGHAHGGQVRIPFIGGLVAPGQGLFPEYTEGVYTEETTSMVVSRGLGNSIIPLRVNNRPELLCIELTCADQ